MQQDESLLVAILRATSQTTDSAASASFSLGLAEAGRPGNCLRLDNG